MANKIPKKKRVFDQFFLYHLRSIVAESNWIEASYLTLLSQGETLNTRLVFCKARGVMRKKKMSFFLSYFVNFSTNKKVF